MPEDVEQEKQVVSSDVEEAPQPVSAPAHNLTDQSSISSCALPYKQELQLRGKSNYTVTCFLSDLKMLGDFVGHDIPVGRISKEHLTGWLMKLKFGEAKEVTAAKTPASETPAPEIPGSEMSVPETPALETPAHKPPAPKTMARRMTFLRNFFSWLATEGIISDDPSATLVLERPLPPLPE